MPFFQKKNQNKVHSTYTKNRPPFNVTLIGHFYDGLSLLIFDPMCLLNHMIIADEQIASVYARSNVNKLVIALVYTSPTWKCSRIDGEPITTPSYMPKKHVTSVLTRLAAGQRERDSRSTILPASVSLPNLMLFIYSRNDVWCVFNQHMIHGEAKHRNESVTSGIGERVSNEDFHLLKNWIFR
jgi:hypothetical protein